MSGIRAKLAIAEPRGCPLANLAASMDEPLEDIRYTRATSGNRVVEEFEVDTNSLIDADVIVGQKSTDSLEIVTDELEDTSTVSGSLGLTEVFASERTSRYQLEREVGPCTCELIEDAGHPISDIAVRNGTLEVVLNLPDADGLRDVISTLQATNTNVEVQYLMRHAEEDEADPIIVDRRKLTRRQRQVLEEAYRLGYFEYPRRANATAVANELDIAPSTFSEHLAAAQSRLLESVLE